MGRAKEYWMEQQEEAAHEEKCEWIREFLEDDEVEEYTPEWHEAEEAYEEYKSQMHLDWENLMYEREYQDYWTVEGKTTFQIFNEIIDSSQEIINIEISNQSKRNLLVMLYGHIVAAVEAYLSSTFIEKVLSSEDSNYIRKLVENDPEFGKRKFTIKEIFTKQEELKNEVKLYLRDLIFHKIDKVKPMYKDVLDIDFGDDIKWLFDAVILRHDCVHRAGYDKDGDEVELDKEKVELLINNCKQLVENIEAELQT
jgi:hypothetical protein